MSRTIDPRRPTELSEDQQAQVGRHPEIKLLRRTRDCLKRKIRAEYGHTTRAKGLPIYIAYNNTRLELERRKKAIRKAMLAESKRLFRKCQPAADIARQLGSGAALDPAAASYICTAIVMASPLMETAFGGIPMQRFVTHLILLVSLLFDQTATLSNNVGLHYRRASSKWWCLGLIFVTGMEMISIVIVALKLRVESVEGWARFLPPSVATVIEIAITVPFSLLMLHDTRTYSLKHRLSMATGPNCHLLLLIPFWLWTAVYKRSVFATKTFQLLQAFIHAFPIRYWPLTWSARRSRRKETGKNKSVWSSHGSPTEMLTSCESNDTILKDPRLKRPDLVVTSQQPATNLSAGPGPRPPHYA